MHLEGISSLSFQKGFNKNVYVFGEVHKKGNCQNVPDAIQITEFLQQILLQKDYSVDFFLETGRDLLEHPLDY